MIKLIYFKMRALAEAPQILRRCYDIDYEYMGKEDGCCRIDLLQRIRTLLCRRFLDPL